MDWLYIIYSKYQKSLLKKDVYKRQDLDTAKEAVSLIGNKAQIEFSGNVSLETIKSIAEIGVGFISVGALTHSAKILDLSMKNLKPLN